MKKRIVAIVLAAATALSMTGCAGAVAPAPVAGSAEPAAEPAAEAATEETAAEEEGSGAAPAGAQELTFWTFQAAHQTFMEDAAK